MFDLKNKVVLITGGAIGIGAALIKEIATKTKFIAILDVDVPNGTALEKEMNTKYGADKTKFYKCDVTSDELDKVYDAVIKLQGYIDVVLNSAGIMNDSQKLYKKSIEINVIALISSTLRAYSLMRKDQGGKGGTIINIASNLGLTQFSFLPVYCATKSAVIQFSLSLGDEKHFSRSGVRIITICPGCTNTSLVSEAKLQPLDPLDKPELSVFLNDVIRQDVDKAVTGILEAYKNGKPATVWITSGGVYEDITNDVRKGYAVMGENIRL